MKRLPLVMCEALFTNYASGGYKTMRRTYRLLSGIVTDQTVEQTFMLMLKTSGGLAHGRGITPSTKDKLSVFC